MRRFFIFFLFFLILKVILTSGIQSPIFIEENDKENTIKELKEINQEKSVESLYDDYFSNLIDNLKQNEKYGSLPLYKELEENEILSSEKKYPKIIYDEQRLFDKINNLPEKKSIKNLKQLSFKRTYRPIRAQSCLKRGSLCSPRTNTIINCCSHSVCRCNFWGDQCRCDRMSLLQRWG